MKMNTMLVAAMVVMLALCSAAAAQSQNESLGDYARAVKKVKPASTEAPKVYDNDNLPAESTLSVVGSPAPADNSADKKDQDQTSAADANAKSSDGASPDNKSAAASDKKDDPQLKPGQSTAERDQALDALKKKLDEQKQKVDMAAHELDLAQREYQLKISTFYADPNRLANPNGVYAEQDKYKQEIADKQKALDEAKATLSDMQDRAHREGAPNSVIE